MIIFKNEVKCNKILLPRVNLELLTFLIAADFRVFGVLLGGISLKELWMNPLSPDGFAIRQQGLINCLCPESSHWLQANPAFWINRLTDNGTEQVSCDGSPSLLYLR